MPKQHNVVRRRGRVRTDWKSHGLRRPVNNSCCDRHRRALVAPLHRHGTVGRLWGTNARLRWGIVLGGRHGSDSPRGWKWWS